MAVKKAAVIMGSKSDYSVVVKAADVLNRLGIETTIRVMSAHRSPDIVADFAKSAADNGYGVIIAAAGMAAHLAGAVAANTVLPVIALPVKGAVLDGLDALLASVMMPPGVPVATVAIDGATNAGWLAAQILGVGNPDLTSKLLAEKNALRDKNIADDLSIQP
jgi:5-(carboxyamino)imidazole ribonucleotide mutase